MYSRNSYGYVSSKQRDKKYYITAIVALLILGVVLTGVLCWPLIVPLVPAVITAGICSVTGWAAATAATVFAATVFAVAGAGLVALGGFVTAKLCDWFFGGSKSFKALKPEKKAKHEPVIENDSTKVMRDVLNEKDKTNEAQPLLNAEEKAGDVDRAVAEIVADIFSLSRGNMEPSVIVVEPASASLVENAVNDMESKEAISSSETATNPTEGVAEDAISTISNDDDFKSVRSNRSSFGSIASYSSESNRSRRNSF